MKKTLLMMTALLLSVAMHAQLWQIAPNAGETQMPTVQKASIERGQNKIVSFGEREKVRPMAKAAITPSDNQVWWGYFTGSESRGAVGVGGVDTYHQAICIPADHPISSNKTIKAVRIYLRDTSCLSDLKLWISKSLPTDVANADYVQDLDLSTLQGGDEGNNCGRANDVALTTDYPINGKVYVGYSFTVTKASASAGQYPTVYGGEGDENGLYLRTNKTVPEWGAQNQFGNLALQVLLEGTFPKNSVTPLGFKEKAVIINGTVDVPVKIQSNGVDPVNNISYTITNNSQTSEEMSLNVSPALSGIGSITEVTIPLTGDNTEGVTERTITITKVNGTTNEASTQSVTGTLKTVAEIIARTVLIEEFTTEYCGYCPDAASTLAKTFVSYPDLKDQVALVCHHSGYYTDWLTIDADEAYTWFYNNGGRTYAPAFMWDRYAEDGVTPVESRPGNAAGMKAKIEKRLDELACASIELRANFNENSDKITVEATCKRTLEFSNTPARITLILTEDNIAARSQAGASGKFTHQHVSRAVNSTWGEVLDWSNNQATYSYTFDVNAGWKSEDLKVVAFISGYDSNNPANCTIENAAVTIPTHSETAIEMISSDIKAPTASYNSCGQQLSQPQRGLTIVRLSDGTIKKVMTK